MYPDKKSFSSVKWQRGQPNLQSPETEQFDSTELNRRHRLYQKDPVDDINQKYEKKVEQLRSCLKLINTPFYMTTQEVREAKSRWAEDGPPRFPLIVKRNKGNRKQVLEIDAILEENDEDINNENEDSVTLEEKSAEQVKTVNQGEQEKPFAAAATGARDCGGGDHADERKLVTEYVAVHKKYLLIHMGCYFAFKQFHFPSEFAVAEFSVQNGVGDVISGLIDIGIVPLGFRTSVDEQIKETFIPYPGYNPKFDAYNDALRRIEDFCRRHFGPEEEILLFALKEYIPMVEDGIQWLTEKASESGPVRQLNFKVLPLSVLVQVLGNASQKVPYREKKTDGDYIINQDDFLDIFLHKSVYNHFPELGCAHHQKTENCEGVSHCAESIVKRYVFNASQVLLSLYNIEPLLNYHYPKVLLRNLQPLRLQPEPEDEYGYLKNVKPFPVSSSSAHRKPKNPNAESDTTTTTSTELSSSTTACSTSKSSATSSSNSKSKEVQKNTVESTGERKPLQLPDVTLVPRRSSSSSISYNRRRGINYSDDNSSSSSSFGGHFSRPREADLIVAGPVWNKQDILNHFKVTDCSKWEGGSCYQEASLEPKTKKGDEEDQFTDAAQSDNSENVSSMGSTSNNTTSTDSEPKCAYPSRAGKYGLEKEKTKSMNDSKLKDDSPLKPSNSLGRPTGRGGPQMYKKMLASRKYDDDAGNMTCGRGHGTPGVIGSKTRGIGVSSYSVGMATRRHGQESDSEVDDSSSYTSSVGSYFGDSTSTVDEGSGDEKDETTKSTGLGRGARKQF